jgi:hypothetical protein
MRIPSGSGSMRPAESEPERRPLTQRFAPVGFERHLNLSSAIFDLSFYYAPHADF